LQENQQRQLLFNIQNQGYWSYQQLTKALLSATGGSLSPSYFLLLDMEITECLYHIYTYINYQQENTPSKLDQWGCSEGDFSG
jgi:hypothetical protein